MAAFQDWDDIRLCKEIKGGGSEFGENAVEGTAKDKDTDGYHLGENLIFADHGNEQGQD